MTDGYLYGQILFQYQYGYKKGKHGIEPYPIIRNMCQGKVQL